MKKFLFLALCSLLLCCGYANKDPITHKEKSFTVENSITQCTENVFDISVQKNETRFEYSNLLYAHCGIIFEFTDTGGHFYYVISQQTNVQSNNKYNVDLVYSTEFG